tara:strand:- start:504 stop:851 length:348 start_codon:yes stop_codon:yes gene_type:complete
MAAITSTQITEDGIIVSPTTLDASNTFVNTGKEFIYYNNSSGSSKTITVTAQVTTIDSSIYGEVTKTNVTKVVANGETALVGPFSTEAFNDSSGNCNFAITSYVEGEDAAAILYI